MLVLTRKPSEKIRIGNDVIISIIRIQGDKVRIGIDAPPSCAVHREEVYRLIQSRLDQNPDLNSGHDHELSRGHHREDGQSAPSLAEKTDDALES